MASSAPLSINLGQLFNQIASSKDTAAAIGAIFDQVTTAEGTPSGQLNFDFQVIAALSSFAAAKDPSLAPTSFAMNAIAAQSVWIKLQGDLNSSAPNDDEIKSDFVTFAGDMSGAFGAMAVGFGLQKYAEQLDTFGAGATGVGLGIDYPNTVTYLSNLIQQLSSSNNSIGAYAGADAAAWNAAVTEFSTSLTSLGNLVGSSNISTAAFLSGANSIANSFSSLDSSLCTLANPTGSSAPNFSVTINGNNVALTTGTNTTPFITADVTQTSEGALSSIDATSPSGGDSIIVNGQTLNYASSSQVSTSTDAEGEVIVTITPSGGGSANTFTFTNNGITGNNTDGATLSNINVASDGSYTNTIVNANYTAVANYSPSGQPASTTTTFTDGSHINTTYSNDPNSTWQSQTSIYNATGQLVGTAIAYKDGTSTMNDIDPASGTIIATTTDNSQAQPIQQTINPDATYDQVVSATAQALAAELIAQVLIKNQIAGAATQAFADAVIQSELESSNATFTQNLSDDTFGIATGLAGSELGGLLAKDLGISKQVGSLVGATAANFVAQTILTGAAYGVGIVDAAEYVATSSNFETGLLTTAGDEIGQSLAAVITPSTLAGEIIGDVGAAAESADPPPINESVSGVNLDRFLDLFMEGRNGKKTVHGRADHRAFAAC